MEQDEITDTPLQPDELLNQDPVEFNLKDAVIYSTILHGVWKNESEMQE